MSSNRDQRGSHIMGTDQLGRDIFIRLIFGARISLTVGIVVQLVITIVGVPTGLLAGYFGGKVDTAIMRIVDVLYAIPNLLFVIIIMTYLRGTIDSNPPASGICVARFDSKTGGLIGVYIGLGLISWLTVARIVRANTMSLKEKEFIEAAHGLGAGRPAGSCSGTCCRTQLHRSSSQQRLVFQVAILPEAGISFLGLGVIPPMPSWGLMISEAIPNLRSHPYMLIFPASPSR